MFRSRQDAIHWLKQEAPLKYVDGAWLGHIRMIAMPFLFRGVIKNAWQVLSEEYGDGDLKKHHVYIYHKLMESLVPGLPRADSTAFIEPCTGLNDTSAWRAAFGQLLISLFPHEFLPEILGYNLHFESVKLQTLIVARELRELNIDPYYFNLHISIDNANSGHTAIALYSVDQYLQKIGDTQGPQEKMRVWKRVQTGFALSEYLEATSSTPGTQQPPDELPAMTDVDKSFINIIRAKCLASDKIHCGSTVAFGGRKVAEWLSHPFLSSKGNQMRFLHCLSNTTYWVQKGNSDESRLVKEICWGGRIFGAFTNSEVSVVKAWIESLGQKQQQQQQQQLYWSFTERTPIVASDKQFHHGDILTDYPIFSPSAVSDIYSRHLGVLPPDSIHTSRINNTGSVNTLKLLPLWFAHPCLLHSFLTIPFKSMTPAHCAVLRFLRAQAGFGIESAGVAGMDEVTRTDYIGIQELGLEMARLAGLMVPSSLKVALEEWSSEFARRMLHLSMCPDKDRSTLVGLAWAFVDLHDAIALGCLLLLSHESCVVLKEIARRERESLVESIGEMQGDDVVYQQISQGYAWGREEIQHCFV